MYGFIPVGVTLSDPNPDNFLALAMLEVTFFVNAAGLFYLSALIEKYNTVRGNYEDGKKGKEVTTLKMLPALVEGVESFLFFCVMIIFPEHQWWIYVVFAGGVTISVLQRLHWAYMNIN